MAQLAKIGGGMTLSPGILAKIEEIAREQYKAQSSLSSPSFDRTARFNIALEAATRAVEFALAEKEKAPLPDSLVKVAEEILANVKEDNEPEDVGSVVGILERLLAEQAGEIDRLRADFEQYIMRLAAVLTVADGGSNRSEIEAPDTVEYVRSCPTMQSVLRLRERAESAERELAEAREAIRDASCELSGDAALDDERLRYEEIQLTRGWRQEWRSLPAVRAALVEETPTGASA